MDLFAFTGDLLFWRQQNLIEVMPKQLPVDLTLAIHHRTKSSYIDFEELRYDYQMHTPILTTLRYD